MAARSGASLDFIVVGGEIGDGRVNLSGEQVGGEVYLSLILWGIRAWCVPDGYCFTFGGPDWAICRSGVGAGGGGVAVGDVGVVFDQFA